MWPSIPRAMSILTSDDEYRIGHTDRQINGILGSVDIDKDDLGRGTRQHQSKRRLVFCEMYVRLGLERG
jgi:hypothetical protein